MTQRQILQILKCRCIGLGRRRTRQRMLSVRPKTTRQGGGWNCVVYFEKHRGTRQSAHSSVRDAA